MYSQRFETGKCFAGRSGTRQTVNYSTIVDDFLLLNVFASRTDFGLCKEHIHEGITAWTFCGTIEYM